MCKFASFVLTKDGEFWLPSSNSHTDIIQHFGLHEDGSRGPNVLRIEIVPGPKIKHWKDYKNWVYRIDQDIMPAWSDAQADEKRARAALRKRAKEGFQTVDARGCTALTELKADAAKTVYARGCTALTLPKRSKATVIR
jgi:hypothetical protein